MVNKAIKHQLNFGFMLKENPSFEIPANFDRMNEDEIAKMFYGEDIETLNKIFEEMAQTQSNS